MKINDTLQKRLDEANQLYSDLFKIRSKKQKLAEAINVLPKFKTLCDQLSNHIDLHEEWQNKLKKIYKDILGIEVSYEKVK